MRRSLTASEAGLGADALAAIQGLHQLVKEKDAKIAAQSQEIAELRDRVSRIEMLKADLDALKVALTALPERRRY